MLIKARVGWVQMNKLWLCIGAYRIFWGLANWVPSTVAELDDTRLYFMGVQWDSVRATDSVSAEAYVWKTALG
jgi:hypothetical protein